MRIRALAALALAAAGCLEFSPHAADLQGSERDLNRKAIARLQSGPAPSILRFALVGDVQIAFDEAEDAVEHLNRRDDLAFVVQLGDFTHVGTLQEFREMNEIFERLRVPYLAVIGNHDHLGNGRDIFVDMFGPTEIAFTYAGVRFVLFDSNSREADFDGTVPDVDWLAAQLAPDGAHDRAVLLSHVPPSTSDFDPVLEEPYRDVLRSAPSVVSFHAHEHRFRSGDVAGTPLWVADAVEHRNYLVATVAAGGGIEVERVFF